MIQSKNNNLYLISIIILLLILLRCNNNEIQKRIIFETEYKFNQKLKYFLKENKDAWYDDSNDGERINVHCNSTIFKNKKLNMNSTDVIFINKKLREVFIQFDYVKYGSKDSIDPAGLNKIIINEIEKMYDDITLLRKSISKDSGFSDFCIHVSAKNKIKIILEFSTYNFVKRPTSIAL